MATRTSPIYSATTCCSSGAVGLPKLSRGCTASAAPYPVQSPTRPSWRSGCTLPIPPLPKSATRRQSTIAHATRTTFNTSSKLWQVTRLGLSTFSRIGIALCSPTQTVPTAPMDLLGVRSKKTTKIFSHLRRRSRVPGRPAFILPHRRLPAVSHPPNPLRNVPLQHPRAGRSRKIASRLRTAAIPVPRGACSATARANVVVERPV
ncbi:hypothetical protein B0H14DRAFT_2790801 [Mycena olivaceomarginata]|nr:hypothetical protein B0H14DRAFT_2790801 [Mycena olivaceomarginata]